jgi:hypothetical protein
MVNSPFADAGLSPLKLTCLDLKVIVGCFAAEEVLAPQMLVELRDPAADGTDVYGHVERAPLRRPVQRDLAGHVLEAPALRRPAEVAHLVHREGVAGIDRVRIGSEGRRGESGAQRGDEQAVLHGYLLEVVVL